MQTKALYRLTPAAKACRRPHPKAGASWRLSASYRRQSPCRSSKKVMLASAEAALLVVEGFEQAVVAEEDSAACEKQARLPPAEVWHGCTSPVPVELPAFRRR